MRGDRNGKGPDMTDGSLPTLTIERGNESWKLIMQSGVGFQCTVGTPVNEFLRREFDLSPEGLKSIEAVLIDGMTVDDPEVAILPDRCRLALAAGLPGAAGLAMRVNSGVKGLRSGITYLRDDKPDPRPGTITLLLYALVLPVIAGGVLRHGVLATIEQIRRYAQFAPGDRCRSARGVSTIGEWLAANATQPDSEVFELVVEL